MAGEYVWEDRVVVSTMVLAVPQPGIDTVEGSG